MAGFASLLTSGVKPVWWFGLMMTIGLGVGLVVTVKAGDTIAATENFHSKRIAK